MLQLLFRKWWVVLLQGILLIILSIYIFQNPVEVLAGISLWFGLLVLAAGVLGIIGWLAADKPEREGMSLFWSILTADRKSTRLNSSHTVISYAVFCLK